MVYHKLMLKYDDDVNETEFRTIFAKCCILDVWKDHNTPIKWSSVIVARGVFRVHCMKSVRIRSFSGPYFPSFRLNTERYRIQTEYVFSSNEGKYAVTLSNIFDRTFFTNIFTKTFTQVFELSSIGERLI